VIDFLGFLTALKLKLCSCGDDLGVGRAIYGISYMENGFLETCKPVYHLSCLLEWFENCDTRPYRHSTTYQPCPICRKEISDLFSILCSEGKF